MSLYIKNDLIYENIEVLSFCDATIEMVGLKVSIYMYDFFILATYRPHSDLIENFYNKKKHNLENENWINKEVILIGDFNINLSNESSENDIFSDIMSSFQSIPQTNKLTTFPTGVRENPSLLNHIWLIFSLNCIFGNRGGRGSVWFFEAV